jgi:hypothetical protein
LKVLWSQGNKHVMTLAAERAAELDKSELNK